MIYISPKLRHFYDQNFHYDDDNFKLNAIFWFPSWKLQQNDTNRSTNAQREKFCDVIYDMILIFIYGMLAQHSYLITQRGGRKPQIFIYVCKNTTFEWKFTILLTKSFDVVFVLKIFAVTTKKAETKVLLFAKQFSNLKNKRNQINIDGFSHIFIRGDRGRGIRNVPWSFRHPNCRYFTILFYYWQLLLPCRSIACCTSILSCASEPVAAFHPLSHCSRFHASRNLQLLTIIHCGLFDKCKSKI